MKIIDKLRIYKELLNMCKIIQINNELDEKANQIYGNDIVPKMKIKSLYRKVGH